MRQSSTMHRPGRVTPRLQAQSEKDIETARRETLQTYHAPWYTTFFDNWYYDQVKDPVIFSRVEELYDDYKQTSIQYNAFDKARCLVIENEIYASGGVVKQELSDDEAFYERILVLYRAREEAINEAAIRRLSLWQNWWTEHWKPDHHRNDGFVAACESTLVFLEDDYVKRKVDFVTEIYALTEKNDPAMAKMVLNDLGNMFPWLMEDFIPRLKNQVVMYDGLKKVLPQV